MPCLERRHQQLLGSTSMPIRACIIAPQSTITNILDCIKNDKAYQDIIDVFQQGKSLADLNESHPAWCLKQVWGQLSLTNDGVLIVDGTKLYMPPGEPRTRILRQLYEGHCGYGKTLQTARELYYWPSMKYDIRAMVDNCEACQILRPSKPLEQPITTTASFPMEQISIESLSCQGQNLHGNSR